MSHQRCAGWLQGLSFLGVCREVVGIGAALDALWGECGIGAVGKGVESMLWWMRCGVRCGIDAVVDTVG